MADRIFGNLLLFARNNLPRKQCEEFFKQAVSPRALRSISTTTRALTSSDGENINEHSDGRPKRMMRIAMIGEPNCGKSTLTNRLVCNQVSVVSHVPHTTRQRTLGVYTEGNSQLVLLDTPGIVTVEDGKRLKMSKEHMRAPANCLDEVDLVAVLADASNKYQRFRIHHEILSLLDGHPELQSILILNKIDQIRHKVKLLNYSAILTSDRQKDKWGYLPNGGSSRFDHVFMVSALTGDGVDHLREYMVAKATPGSWLYSAGVTTDLDIQEQIAEVFRGKLLSLYKHEIPWQTRQVNIFCEQKEDGVLKVHQKLYCRRDSQRRCILEKIDELRKVSKDEIEKMLSCEVDLTLEVGVSKAMVHNPVPMV